MPICTNGVAWAQRTLHHGSQSTGSECKLRTYLEMDNPSAAAAELRDAARSCEGFTISLRGHMALSSPRFTVPSGEIIQLQESDTELHAILKEHGNSKKGTCPVTCILRLATAETFEDYCEQIADVLALGVRLYPADGSDWVFYCLPTVSQMQALERLHFVSSIRVFRPEYKYRNPALPGDTYPDLMIWGVTNLEDSQLQDLRNLGYTVRSHKGNACTVLGAEADPTRIAQLWWVKRIIRHYMMSTDDS